MSATLDSRLFAEYFPLAFHVRMSLYTLTAASAPVRPAPVLSVGGKCYPVEEHYLEDGNIKSRYIHQLNTQSEKSCLHNWYLIFTSQVVSILQNVAPTSTISACAGGMSGDNPSIETEMYQLAVWLVSVRSLLESDLITLRDDAFQLFCFHFRNLSTIYIYILYINRR